MEANNKKAVLRTRFFVFFPNLHVIVIFQYITEHERKLTDILNVIKLCTTHENVK